MQVEYASMPFSYRGLERVAKGIYFSCRAMAWFGGLVLIVLALLSVLSISGRALSQFGLGPIPGDFELVEAGTAVAVFCFLPWCHLRNGHATVDLLWRYYPPLLRRMLEVTSNTLMCAIWVLLVWRMAMGMLDYRGYGETTFILQMPVWWGYAAALVPGLLGCIAYAWRMLESLGLVKPPEGFSITLQGTH